MTRSFAVPCGAPLCLIAAMGRNRVIGVRNRMPWHLPQDLKHFRAVTSGHPVIMGRKTFESIGKPLPNRQNIVISRDPSYAAPGVQSATSLERAIELACEKSPRQIFVIGGAEIYKLALPMADRLYLTLIQEDYEGDAYFPDWKEYSWKEVSRETHLSEGVEAVQFSFVTLERVGKA